MEVPYETNDIQVPYEINGLIEEAKELLRVWTGLENVLPRGNENM
jgi:hypothetical protein